MAGGRREHPPKKKHANTPRKPLAIPLTDAERRQRASEAFQLAKIHLDEAEKLADFGRAPNACVHAGYYAMHHCATAVLFVAGGVGPKKDVPKSHEHVLEHFGKLVEGEPGLLGDAGRVLGRARADRTAADYGATPGATAMDASATAADAKAFVAACADRWGLEILLK